MGKGLIFKKKIKKTKNFSRTISEIQDKLCIAFDLDNELLFLGDLNSNSINEALNVKGEIDTTRNNYSYEIVVAAHHGTRWNTELTTLEISKTIASNGLHENKNYCSFHNTVQFYRNHSKRLINTFDYQIKKKTKIDKIDNIFLEKDFTEKK